MSEAMADLEEEIRWAGDDPERLEPLYSEKRRLLTVLKRERPAASEETAGHLHSLAVQGGEVSGQTSTAYSVGTSRRRVN